MSDSAPRTASRAAGLLDGRVAVITGASGQLGRATARAFAAAGARIALVGRDPDKLRRAFADIPEIAGARVLYLGADLADPASAAGVAEAVVAGLGSFDVLAHLAGAFHSGSDVHETPPELWETMLGANLMALVTVLGAVAPVMVRQRRGSIVVVAARAALEGRAGLGAYCAAKAAAVRVVESLAEELRPSGVRANCVLPEAISAAPRGAGDPRSVSPDELADVLVFLAADASRALSGAAIPA